MTQSVVAEPSTTKALKDFVSLTKPRIKYSLLYLGLLFLAMAIDRRLVA